MRATIPLAFVLITNTMTNVGSKSSIIFNNLKSQQPTDTVCFIPHPQSMLGLYVGHKQYFSSLLNIDLAPEMGRGGENRFCNNVHDYGSHKKNIRNKTKVKTS